jgi:2-polyprenyl-6-methoxyphenol hydroxylase-like FAD-dependent oxidoreductase
MINRAVVVGGGMGGLFAAAALSPHAEEVVMVDRDEIPDEAVPRNGTPQSRHPHVLMFGGMDAMCEWFPGFADDVLDAGAITAVWGREYVVYRREGMSYSVNAYMPEPADLGTMYVLTRPVLETCVRRRVLSLPNVALRTGTRIEDLVHDGGRVTGTRDAQGAVLDADLVVDASGRQSRLPMWLEAMGFPRPAQETVNCDNAYSTTIIVPADWDALPATVAGFGNYNEGEFPSRGAAIFKLSGGRWMASLAGRHGDYPPMEWEAWCEWSRTVRNGPLAELVAGATPIEGPVRYRLPAAIRWRYDLLDRFPDGIIPIGDAIAFFNPIYGQGMSAAAGECRALHAVLARRAAAGEGLDGLALEYFPQMAEWARTAWALAAAGDFEDPNCTGDFPADDMPDVEKLGALAASTDPHDRQLSLDIATLRKPLAALHNSQSA